MRSPLKASLALALCILTATLPRAMASELPIIWWNFMGPTNLTSLRLTADARSSEYYVGDDGILWSPYPATNAPVGTSGWRSLAGGTERDFVVGARDDGAVEMWGQVKIPNPSLWEPDLIVPSYVTNIIAVGAGARHAMALRADGRVFTWGVKTSPWNRSLVAPRSLTNAVKIACGDYHAVALKSDATIFGWGGNAYGEVTFPAALSNVVDVAASANATIVCLADGTVRVFGGYGLQPPEGLLDVKQVAAGAYEMFALKSDGTVVSWTPQPIQRDFRRLKGVTRIHAERSRLVTWTKAPILWEYPTNKIAAPGTLVKLTTTAASATPLMYQWYRDETAIEGATNATHEFTAAQELTGDYWVRAINLHDFVDSPRSHVLIGKPAVKIVTPYTKTLQVDEGGWIMLAAETISPTPVTYRWFFGETDITPVNSPMNTNAQALNLYMKLSDAGSYSVVAANEFGSTRSEPVTITVKPAPVMDQHQEYRGASVSLRDVNTKRVFAQTFAPGISGRLAQVEFAACWSETIPESPTRVRILDVTSEGKPGTNVLGTAFVAHLRCEMHPAIFDKDDVYLRAGQRYAMEFSTDAPSGMGSTYSFFASFEGDPYPAGALWQSVNGSAWSKATFFNDGVTYMDLVFRTYMWRGLPEATLTSPSPGARFSANEVIQITAASMLTNGAQVASFSFYADNTQIGAAISEPFTFLWTNAAVGTHSIKGELIDTTGRSVWTAPVTVSVRIAGPANDDLQDAPVLTTNYARVAVNNTNASLEPGEPRVNSAAAGRTVWWKWRASKTGPVVITTHQSSDPGLVIGVFTGNEITTLLGVTNGVSLCRFEALTNTVYSISVDSMSTNDHDIVLYVAAADVQMASPSANAVRTAPATVTLETTNAMRAITEIKVMANATEVARFTSQPYKSDYTFTEPGRYQLTAAATDTNGVTTISSPRLLTVRPRNDRIENAITLNGYSGQVHCSIFAATFTAPDPPFAENVGGHSIWYKWTAPEDGLMTLRGSGPPAGVLFVGGVWRDGVFNIAAENGTYAHGGRIAFPVIAGTTYHIMVDAIFDEESLIDWSYSLNPLSDAFSRRITLLDADFAAYAPTRNTSLEEDEPPLPAGVASPGTIWWRWIAPLAGEVTFHVASADSVAGITVFGGSEFETMGTLGEVPATNSVATLTFNVQKGDELQIRAIVDSQSQAPIQFSFTTKSLRILSPDSGSVHRGPARILLSAQLSDGEPISNVAFSANGSALTTLQAEGGGFVWNDVPAGSYRIAATATSQSGVNYESLGMTILVYTNDVSPEPQIFAGPWSKTSYVIDAVGAVHVFGQRPTMFPSFSHNDTAFPAVAANPDGVSRWKTIDTIYSTASFGPKPWAYALTEDGVLYANDVVPLQTNVRWKAVFAGEDFYAIAENGLLYRKGVGGMEIASDLNLKQFVSGWQYSAGFGFAFGLTESGEVWIFGTNIDRRDARSRLPYPAGVTRWTRLAAGLSEAVVEGNNGRLYLCSPRPELIGGGHPGPVAISLPSGVTSWKEVIAGGFHWLAIGNDNNLYTWGRNVEGQLGYPGADGKTSPTKVTMPPGVTAWLKIAAGQFHTLALGNDCSLYAWGLNASGELGIGQIEAMYTPTRVLNLDQLCGMPLMFFDSERATLPDGSFSLSFDTIANRGMIIQYSSDMESWKTANAPVIGNGERMTWIDDGPPKTESHPSSVSNRYYRVILGP